MITKLGDFLRRRSKIEQVIPKEDIIHAPGLKEACKLLFGEDAEAKLDEYIGADRQETIIDKYLEVNNGEL